MVEMQTRLTRSSCADCRCWTMESEDVAALGGGIELIGELRLDAGGFISERQWVTPLWVDVEQALTVFVGLFFNTSQRMPFGFRFDRPDCFSINEEKVISFVA